MEAVRRSIRSFEDKRYAFMKQRNIIGQVCHTPKSYDNVMHVGLRKVTFKWQRGNKIGTMSTTTEFNPTFPFCFLHILGCSVVAIFLVTGFEHSSSPYLQLWCFWRHHVQ